ncbi:FtsP/CotA-like multicopper oxidase with cupredoxin domain [Nonomuraea muscovyensis]|uniref:FtsP/CotA-like multicopper oxidase with cupredoxin domain n=1 Tax=Nonomuraea muscovyensis TaxID=1124761 RepID=A0A7X0EZ17_9ACTN|nr:multicopper oxidase family protein [Nonomuraea muscovyensis]MBB6347029.1 FtsP/CotA-like multicopper oxidase with cupredoxin domain [Nonomuraea muscovyensis]
MSEPLFVTDMLLAIAVVVAAVAGAAGRWALYGLASLVGARLVVAGVLLTGGFALAEPRLLLQVPLAVLPVGWALATRSAASVAAAKVGAGLSGLWLFVPFDALLELAVSAVAVGLAVLVARWRDSGPLPSGGPRLARAPWLALPALLAPAVVLGVAYQDNVSAAERHHHAAAGGRSVEQLTGPRDETPDARFTLTAAHGRVRLSSGREIDALTFNGRSPGPELRVKAGRLVEVTLVNTDVEEGVTLHWHGVDVPNAEDGVPGVTQEAVEPGGRHVYRFVPDRPGTFWYHTHRGSAQTVRRGLFGALIVEEEKATAGTERTVFTHLWPGADEPVAAFDTADRPEGEAVAAGEPVLLRVVNSSEEPHLLRLGGTPYTVTAIDGNAVRGPAVLRPGTDLLLAAGGRFDVAFTMPDGPVTLSGDVDEIPDSAALVLSPGGDAAPAPASTVARFDPLSYGEATATAVGEAYDKTFDLALDDGFGFAMGRLNYVSSSVNGRLWPAVPMLTVDEGDRVRMRIVNRSLIDHPMHLHGHRVRVLSRNGVPATGSTWWTDTLNVAPGEIYEIDFTADNPGIWMDHCHNFTHASEGMVMHLGYAGVTTPHATPHNTGPIPE